MMSNIPFLSNRIAQGGLFVLASLVLAGGLPVAAQEHKTDQRYLIYVDGIT